jgi:hypothetical protein
MFGQLAQTNDARCGSQAHDAPTSSGIYIGAASICSVDVVFEHDIGLETLSGCR